MRRRQRVVVGRIVAIIVTLLDHDGREEAGRSRVTSRSEFSHPPAVVDAVGLALGDFDDVAFLERDLVAARRVVVVQRAAKVR